MPRLLSFLTRAFALLAVLGMAAGVIAAAPGGAAARERQASAEADTTSRTAELAYALLGNDDGSCALDEGEGPMVDCGAQLFGEFVHEALVLELSRESCSVLLEELFGEPGTCRMEDRDCQRFEMAAPAPPSTKLASTSASGSAALFDRLHGHAPGGVVQSPPPGSSRRPDSLTLEPPVPPPRRSLV